VPKPKTAGNETDGGASAIIGGLLRYGWIVVALVLLGVSRGCASPG
jgi:hypothetical protein